MEKIYKTKILKEKRKVQNNNNINNDKRIIMKIIEKKRLKLFHFDNYTLTPIRLHRKLVRKIFGFPKYTLHSHQELICYH